MRKLLDGTNVDAATGDYPNGRTRDKDGATPGTILNEVLLGDIQQFFQKLLIDSGLTENDTPDNDSNGYQLIEALIAKIDALNGGLRTVVVDIEDWNMDTSLFVTIGAVDGVTFDNYRGAQAIIYKDDLTEALDLVGTDSLGSGGSVKFSASAGLQLSRMTGGRFDSLDYVTTSFNRGKVIVYYDPTA